MLFDIAARVSEGQDVFFLGVFYFIFIYFLVGNSFIMCRYKLYSVFECIQVDRTMTWNVNEIYLVFRIYLVVIVHNNYVQRKF